ncbi:MAG: HNH endonuclease family protein [Bifidobacteriaceae bacterium]|nr:HNH endonuclease family protein [Bifidobacteriaceae bacterium]
MTGLQEILPGSTVFRPQVEAWELEQAARLLGALPVRPEGAAPRGAYSREALTAGWLKFSGVPLDMKDHIFARHFSDLSYDPDGFTVRRAVLDRDPYTGELVEFTLAEDRSDWQIEIDHVVSLKDAWLSGAWRWSPKGRNWTKFYKN